MRTNLPVTTREYPFPAGETLVSTTDLKGRIVYCNPAFIEVSGYAKDELLGQPHNLIRHPDMPEEAFRDMWDTIAAGLPWSALVKNRRKNGDFYWVMANVTPLLEGDRPVGYMSVRTLPTRPQVQEAEALYTTLRAEKQNGVLIHRLQQGRVVRATPLGRLASLLQPGLAGKMGLLALGLSGSGFLAAVLAGATPSPQGLLLGTLALGLLSLGGARLLHGLTVAPLDKLIRFTNRMAAGDLTQTLAVDRHDAIGTLGRGLNQLNVNLMSIVRDARSEVANMRNATREIAAGNHDLSARTESQASSLEETAASMEQITGTVRQSADSAREAEQLAGQTTAITQRSSAAVDRVTTTMREISGSAQRITEIIGVIDGIAFQTNILALNAAVEAARAGEQGRGFAVVASEVRALAQRSSNAAREIKQLIESSTQKVDEGSRLSDEARATMTEALGAVQRVGTLIQEISHGAREQLSGISQVNEAVAQMDTITQQNAALVEELAASASSLEQQAETVQSTVAIFRIDGHAAHQPLPDAVALRREAKVSASAAMPQPA